MEELQQMQPDDTSRQKMLDILKRFHSEEEEEMDDMDEDDSTLSEETIQRILSGMAPFISSITCLMGDWFFLYAFYMQKI